MHDARPTLSTRAILAEDSRFVVRLAVSHAEIESAMRLRFRVFNEELGSETGQIIGLDSDAHDETSEHLLLISKSSDEIVGTYRLKSIERAGDAAGFYSNDEFTLDALPEQILREGVETGRACIAGEHRNTRAIFLLWKALARHLSATGKRYFFGCCSIFTKDPADGPRAFRYLESQGFVHEQYQVLPRRPILVPDIEAIERFKLPGLFEMYLRIGSRVCGPPMYDDSFGTVDFFVLFDLQEMSPKYRQMFLED
jgi:putative hemolysin